MTQQKQSVPRHLNFQSTQSQFYQTRKSDSIVSRSQSIQKLPKSKQAASKTAILLEKKRQSLINQQNNQILDLTQQVNHFQDYQI